MEFTINQVVALNLRRARTEAGLTQDRAAAKLEPYLGRRWTRAQFSNAEKSAFPAPGRRIKEFDADEIAAFSLAFERPLVWFFLPPPNARLRGRGATKSLRTIEWLQAALGADDIRTVAKRLPEYGANREIALSARERLLLSLVAEHVDKSLKEFRESLSVREFLETLAARFGSGAEKADATDVGKFVLDLLRNMEEAGHDEQKV